MITGPLFGSQVHHAVEEEHNLLRNGDLFLFKLPNSTVHHRLENKKMGE